MTDESWTSASVLGQVPASHQDPCLGGPPFVSPDGHWWWDGAAWVSRVVGDTAA